MNILFIGYWAFHEGLTSSTIFPHLHILSDFPTVNKVIFTSIERDLSVTEFKLDIDKVTHIPLYSSNSSNVFKNKWHDFTVFPKQLIQYCKEYEIDKIICRGAPAGALGYMVWKKTNIPFAVESFEPHADYMLESGVWKKWDPRYVLQKYWEKKQKKYAELLIPVAYNYKKRLIEEGVSEAKIAVIPCTVDLEQFNVDAKKRVELRQQLGFTPATIVGIYVGKFGGLYYREEAFRFFKVCKNHWKSAFKLVLLSPQPEDEIQSLAASVDLTMDDVVLKNVLHRQVSDYLNVADIAFTFYKTGPSKQYLSPIKVGEYWACGLPVLISEGIGDDSGIVQKEKAGLVLGEKLAVDVEQLEELLKKPNSFYRAVAQKYRNREIDKRVYSELLGCIAKT